MTGVAAGWNDFFVAEVGAAAALAGLVFVAVSINLKRILEFPHLPARVLEGLMTLLSVLVVSTFALVPGQASWLLGIEMAGAGLVAWAIKTAALRRARASGVPYRAPVLRVLLNQLPPLPFLVAGVLLVAGKPGGIYWTVPGILFSFAAGIVDIWVLLIEIQR